MDDLPECDFLQQVLSQVITPPTHTQLLLMLMMMNMLNACNADYHSDGEEAIRVSHLSFTAGGAATVAVPMLIAAALLATFGLL